MYSVEAVAAPSREEAVAHRNVGPLDIGKAASSRQVVLLPHETDPGIILSPLHISAISLISQGNTIIQVARQLDCEKAQAKQLRRETMRFFKTERITVATNKSLASGLVDFEVTPDPETALHISGWDRKTLRLYARGVSNHQLALAANKDVLVIEGYHDRLLKRMGAWSRPHAMRRAYELGIFRKRKTGHL